jgi:DMSO/TMAO reductase YedYZ molybdopterin-dependent catalytic subunit
MFDSFFRRREDETLFAASGRLPPGQSVTQKFPVLHYGPMPKFNPETWDLRVWGDVEDEARWTWEQFNQLPRTKIVMDLHCVTRWSKFDTLWEGVSLRTLVDQGLIKLKPTARYLLQHAE